MAGMTRDDQIRATVAAGMQDSGVICEALQDWTDAIRREGGTNTLLHEVAHAVAESSMDGVTQAHRETLANRLLTTLEHYSRVVLTDKADDDLPQPDDEENDNE